MGSIAAHRECLTDSALPRSLTATGIWFGSGAPLRRRP